MRDLAAADRRCNQLIGASLALVRESDLGAVEIGLELFILVGQGGQIAFSQGSSGLLIRQCAGFWTFQKTSNRGLDLGLIGLVGEPEKF